MEWKFKKTGKPIPLGAAQDDRAALLKKIGELEARHAVQEEQSLVIMVAMAELYEAQHKEVNG